MKLWIDDVRPAPEGYFHCKTVNHAKKIIIGLEGEEEFYNGEGVELIDIDHDAGEYVSDGGDYIKLLEWLEETGRNYPIRIHSMNPVGRNNMLRIIRKNGWKEIKY